jgi:hypothetical protein
VEEPAVTEAAVSLGVVVTAAAVSSTAAVTATGASSTAVVTVSLPGTAAPVSTVDLGSVGLESVGGVAGCGAAAVD